MSTTDDNTTTDDLPEWRINGQIESPVTLKRLIESKDARIDALEERIIVLESTLEDYQRELDELRDQIDHTNDRVDDIDQRTDLLRLLDDDSDTSADEARVAVLQHMWRAIRNEAAEDQRITLTRERVIDILHHPDVHRTTINGWMETLPSMFHDDLDVDEICWYDGGSPGPGGQQARIHLDLRDVDAQLPELVETPLTN